MFARVHKLEPAPYPEDIRVRIPVEKVGTRKLVLVARILPGPLFFLLKLFFNTVYGKNGKR